MVKLTVPSLVLKNLSTKDLRPFGVKIRPGQSRDMFQSVVGLTEERIFKALSGPNGELYVKLSRGELVVVSTTLSILENSADTTVRKHGLTDVSADVSTLKPDVQNIKNHHRGRDYREHNELAHRRNHEKWHVAIASGMSGDMTLRLSDAADGYIAASVLNDGYRSSVKLSVGVILENSKKIEHVWANFDLDVSVTEVILDGDIAAPTVTKKTLKAGRGLVEISFDIDGGVANTYQAGDYVDVVIGVSADDTWLGHAVTPVSKTFRVS